MTRDFVRTKRPFSTARGPILVLIILLAFWLRLHHLDAFSFWTDEGLTSLRSGYSIAGILNNRVYIQEGVTNDTHPAFYFLMIHFTRQLFGETDFAYRFPSTLSGVLLVPIMFQFGRRLRDDWVGLVAGLLTAVNAIYIWYANEARMYTTVVLLMAVASYVLWRALAVSRKPLAVSRKPSPITDYGLPITDHGLPITDHGSPITKHLILYTLFAGLALYTHYFSVFIIAGQALFWVWILWQRGQKRLVLGMAAIGIVIAIPLIPYTIPRLLGGNEANFFYVSPGIILQDVIRFFGPGNFVDFKQLFIKFLTIGFSLLLLLGIFTLDSWRKRNFLLIYLLAIIIGISLGSIIKPIYQGPRHILAGSPAYILLVSWGIVWLWGKVRGPWSVVRSPKAVIRSPKAVVRGRITVYGLMLTVLAFAATAVPLTSSTIAINNLYNDPHYEKDSLRNVIQFIEQEAGDNDVIVYNNAILLPLHEHYQTRQDVDVTASPIYPYQSNDVAVPQLADLAATYDRIWFITDPPADKRDREKIVEQWLNTHTTLIHDYPFPAKNTRLSAIVFDTKEHIGQVLPETAVSLSHQWPNTPTLQGFQLNATEPIAASTFWVDLFWQGSQPTNTWVRFQLIGEDSQEWARSEYALIPHEGPVTKWPNDAIIHFSYPVRLPIGIPPGQYTLKVQPFASKGSAFGDFQKLTDITIASSGEWVDAGKRPFADTQSIYFQNGIRLMGIELADSEVRPGHALPIAFLWQSSANDIDLQNITYTLNVRQANGDVINQIEGKPSPSWLTEWPVNTPVREPTGLYFPPETEPGRYILEWQLLDGDDVVRGRPFWQPWSSQTVTLGEIDVIPWPKETNLPADVTLLQAQFGDTIQLYGYTLSETTDSLQLTLIWQAQSAPDKNYAIFVHLVDQDGNIVQQRDTVPVDGLRPTAGWRPDEVLTDMHTLSLPPDLADGTYALRVGLYEPNTFIRLPISYRGEMQPNDQLELTTIAQP